MAGQISRILIVDDQPVGRQLLESFLFELGHELYFAEDGEQAYEMTLKHKPHLVLLDVMMPKLDGYEVCKLIRKNKEIENTPIVMVTALEDRDSRLQGITAGADDYITKPIDRLELLARVKNIVELSRLRLLSQGVDQPDTSNFDAIYRAIEQIQGVTPISAAQADVYSILPESSMLTFSRGTAIYSNLRLLFFARFGGQLPIAHFCAALFRLGVRAAFYDKQLHNPSLILKSALDGFESIRHFFDWKPGIEQMEAGLALADTDKKEITFSGTNFGISLISPKISRGVSVKSLNINDIFTFEFTNSTLQYQPGDTLVWMPVSSRDESFETELPGLVKKLPEMTAAEFTAAVRGIPTLKNSTSFALEAFRFH